MGRGRGRGRRWLAAQQQPTRRPASGAGCSGHHSTATATATQRRPPAAAITHHGRALELLAAVQRVAVLEQADVVCRQGEREEQSADFNKAQAMAQPEWNSSGRGALATWPERGLSAGRQRQQAAVRACVQAGAATLGPRPSLARPPNHGSPAPNTPGPPPPPPTLRNLVDEVARHVELTQRQLVVVLAQEERTGRGRAASTHAGEAVAIRPLLSCPAPGPWRLIAALRPPCRASAQLLLPSAQPPPLWLLPSLSPPSSPYRSLYRLQHILYAAAPPHCQAAVLPCCGGLMQPPDSHTPLALWGPRS